MLRRKPAVFGLAAMMTVASMCSAADAEGGGIVILAGQFGTIGVNRKLDIARPLAQLCGTGSDRCDVFCSETSFGRYRLGRKPICRVSYRCPDGSTRAAEAAREEPIMLRCRDEEAAAGPAESLASGQ